MESFDDNCFMHVLITGCHITVSHAALTSDPDKLVDKGGGGAEGTGQKVWLESGFQLASFK